MRRACGVGGEAEMTRAAYSVPEFAEAISVSERLVWRMLARGRIRSFKVGRLRRIPASELERLVGGSSGGVTRRTRPVSREIRRQATELLKSVGV